MRAVLAFTLLAAASSSLALGRYTCSKNASDSHAPAATPAPSSSGAASVEPTSSASATASASASAAPSGVASAVASATPPAPTLREMKAEEWEGALGKWSFENGELICEGKATSSAIFYKDFHAKDFEASVQFKFDKLDSSAGMLFRYEGTDFYGNGTFYQYEWYSHGSHHDRRLSMMKKSYLPGETGTFWIQIVDPKYPDAPVDKWMTYKVRAEGDHLQTWLDGELVFDKRDTAFVRDGRFGLHTFMPSRMHYRDFRVESLDPKPAAK